jgi:hypothetical protein
VRDRVLNPYKPTGRIIVLCILIFVSHFRASAHETLYQYQFIPILLNDIQFSLQEISTVCFSGNPFPSSESKHYFSICLVPATMSNLKLPDHIRLHLAAADSPTTFPGVGLSPVTDLTLNLSGTSLGSTPRRRLSLSSLDNTPTLMRVRTQQSGECVQVVLP